jgi:hypothetical protein
LGTSNRRYRFTNDVPVVDIGLRLADVKHMGLESEPTDVSVNWWKRGSENAWYVALARTRAYARSKHHSDQLA